MAWNDPLLEKQRAAARGGVPRQRGIDLESARESLSRGLSDTAAIRGAASGQISEMSHQTSAGGSNLGWRPTELGYNPANKTWVFQDQDGELREVEQTPANLFALAEMDLQPITQLPEGYQPHGLGELRTTLSSIAEDTDFFGNFGAAFKTSLGLGASAVDMMIGNDDPSNEWSRATERHAEQQSIGEYKASQGPWFSGIPEFGSGLGTTLGNIAATAVGAVPGIALGALGGTAVAPGPGTVAGAVTTGGLLLTGGAMAGGEQATQFYDSAMEELTMLSPEEAIVEVPRYAELVAENPHASHEDLARQVAIEGARVAAAPAAALGGVEALVGGRLAGNLMRRMGSTTLGRRLGGGVREGEPVQRTLGRRLARGTGRAALAGVAAGTTEMLESGLGQAAGSAYTGLGSSNPLDHMDIREGIAASQAGVLLGFGGRRGNAAQADIGAALNANAGHLSPEEAPAAPGAAPSALPLSPEAPAYQRRPLAPFGNDPNQRELPMRPPADFDLDAGYAQPPSATGDLPAAPPPAGPVQDPSQQPLFTPEGQPAPAAVQPSPEQVQAEQQQQQAVAAFEEIFGFSPLDTQTMEVEAPRVLEFAQENPQLQPVLGVLQDMGLIPRQLEASPEAQAQALGETQQAFLNMPAPDGAPMRVGNQPAPAPRQRTDWGRRVRGPASAQRAAVSMQVPETPEPVAAPAERTPDGRPTGVAPNPLPNPEPMPPGQEQSAQVQRGRRRARTGQPAVAEAPAEQAAPAQLQQAAQAAEQDVVPSTPEPAEDIAAQLDAMADPRSDRQAVFVAAGNEAQLPTELVPEGAIVARNRKRGTLVTFDEAEAKRFRRGRWTDADNARVLGYSETKADVMEEGAEPVVVEARTPEGAVAAQQLATPRNARAAAAAVRRQARADATVQTTTPQRAQAERTARAAEDAPAAVRRGRRAQREESKKKSVGAEPPTERPTRRRTEDLDDTTALDRASARAQAPETPQPAPQLDIVEAARATSSVVRLGNREVATPQRLVTEEGVQGLTLDLRTYALDEAERQRWIERREEGQMTPADMAVVDRLLTNMDALATQLDAAVEAAEERLLERAQNSVEGLDARTAIEHIRGREADAAARTQREREGKSRAGRPVGAQRQSLLTKLDLLAEEALEFGRLVRNEARAEAARPAVEPASSASRRLLPQLFPNLSGMLESPARLREVVERVAQMSDAQIDELVRAVLPRLKGSPLAKQVMRGMSEVAHVAAAERSDTVGRLKRKAAATRTEPVETEPTPERVYEPVDPTELGMEERVDPHVRSWEGDLPREVSQTLNGWVAMLERSGIKADQLQVLSRDLAAQLYPDHFGDMHTGRYAQVRVGDEVRHVIAVDFDAYGEAIGLEVLAHEFGEYAGRAIFNRSDQRTQDAVVASYEAWLTAHGHMSPTEMWRSHAPNLLRSMASAKMDADYAGRFSEWLANHVARYMTTRAEPRGVVEKFFAKVGDFLRQVWSQFAPDAGKPDATVADMLDGWVAGRMRDSAAGTHRIESTAGDIRGLEDAEPSTARKVADAALNRATRGMDSSKKIYSGFQSGGLGGLREAMVNEGAEGMRSFMQSAVGHRVRKVSHWITNMDQLVAVYADTPVGEYLSKWVQGHRRAGQLANIVLNGGEFRGQKYPGVAEAMERAQNLPRKVREQLEGIMHDASHLGMHPDRSFDSQKWLHEGLSDEVVAKLRRRHAALQARWDAMLKTDGATLEIYTALRDAFTDLKQKEYAQLEENIKGMGLPANLESQFIKRLHNGRREITKGPYFPFMREGDWIISAQLPPETTVVNTRAEANRLERDLKATHPGARIMVDPEDGVFKVHLLRRSVMFFNSEAAARAARPAMLENLRQAYDDADVEIERVAAELGMDIDEMVKQPVGKIDGYAEMSRNDTQFMSQLREALRESGKFDAETEALFTEAFIEAMPEFSPRKALLRRENILGASRDMLRAYTTRFFGAAHSYAHSVYNPEIRDNWQAMIKARETFAPASDLTNTLRKHLELESKQRELTFSNSFQNGLLQLTSLSFLAFSPAYILMNALQPFMVTTPTLAGAVGKDGKPIGFNTASRYMKEAYETAPGFFAGRGVKDFKANWQRLRGQKTDYNAHQMTEDMISQFAKDDGEREMLVQMLELGRLDFSFLDVLQDVMQGGEVLGRLSKVTRLGMSFAQQGEAMNRMVTALASYRVARREMGMEADAASRYAHDVIGETQIDYSTFNRPLLLKYPWARVALQFKMFLQGMYGMFVRNAYNAVAGRSPQERTAARKVLFSLFGTHVAIAGINGLGPIAWPAKLALGVVASLMGRDDDDDEWKEPDQIFHEQAAYVFGQRGGEVAQAGLPALFGGDFSNRVGFPNLIETRYMGFTARDTADTTLDKWMLWAMGAPYANIRRTLKGVQSAVDEDPYTYATDMLPSGARAAANAMRLGTQGIVDRDGDQLLGPGELTTPDVVMKALGISPLRESRVYQQRRAERSTLTNINTRRLVLIKKARTADSERAKEASKREIEEFNRSVPKHFQITAGTLTTSARAKARRESGRVTRDVEAVREILQ